MLAEIIAIGSELLGADRLDTNSLFLTRELAAMGIQVVRKSVMPDDRDALASALRESCQRVSLVLCSGGLGPTEDDRTRSAAALALDCGLVRDPFAVTRLRAHFKRRRRPMAAINLRQADRLDAAEWLLNPLGSAPGQWCPTPLGFLVLLPGPPRELQHLFATQVRPRLLALAPGCSFYTRVLSIVGLSESEVDALAAPIYRECSNPATTILSTAAPQIELYFQARGRTLPQAQAQADAIAHRVCQVLGDAVFSRDQQSLAAVVGGLLIARQQTLAIAESCTGGMLGERLTEESGSSRYFLGGVVCYSNAAKRDLVGVRSSTLREHGAVSGACARELAAGICQRMASDWGLSITGVAGPSGGTPSKPVGTVFVGISRAGQPPRAIRFRIPGDRESVRRVSAQYALNQLRLRLLG